MDGGGDMDGGFGPGRADSGRCAAAHSADGGLAADGSGSAVESGAVGSNPAVIERTPSP
jgi:hypothetical protein